MIMFVDKELHVLLALTPCRGVLRCPVEVFVNHIKKPITKQIYFIQIVYQ